MRPVPRPRHLVAAAILAAMAAFYGVMAWQEKRLSPVQVHVATAALREHDPQLYRHDPFFGQPGLRDVHNPIFLGLVNLGLAPSGYRDVLLPYRLMVPVVTLLYLLGMYALLYRHCRSWSVAVFVAIFSSTVTDTLGPAYWGLGPLDTMGPSAWLAALTPLLVLAFLRQERVDDRPSRWRLALIFGLVGLLGNISPAWAMNLTLVLLVVYLGRRRFAPRALPRAIGCGLAAVAGILPYLVYFVSLRNSLPGRHHVAGGMVFEAIRLVDPEYLYPDMPKSLLNWMLLAGLLVVPAILVLGRYERFRARDLSFWMYFGLGALGLALVLQAFSQLLGYLTHKGPPTVEFIHASSLSMLALYVVFSQALTNVFRLVKVHRTMLRCACGVLAAVWMIPSDNLRPLRHASVDTMTMFMEQVDKPEFIRSRHEDAHRRDELAAISAWAAGQTPRDAVFVTDLAEFRLTGRRAIVAARHDLQFVCVMAPWLAGEWVGRIQEMSKALHPKTGKVDVEAVRLLVDDLDDEAPMAGAEAWYVIVRASVAPEPSSVLELIPNPKWGRFYRVYRFRGVSGASCKTLSVTACFHVRVACWAGEGHPITS